METVTTLLGQTAELECVATGNPPPVVSWRRGAQVLPGLEGRVSLLAGLLRVAAVTLDDEGVYTCMAVNSVGVASSDVELIVYGQLGGVGVGVGGGAHSPPSPCSPPHGLSPAARSSCPLELLGQPDVCGNWATATTGVMVAQWRAN